MPKSHPSYTTQEKLETYENSLAYWVRSLDRAGKDHFHGTYGFKCMFGWHSLAIDWGMLTAASRFWSKKTHLFNFSYNEMCPTHEEFCAITGMAEGGRIALPNFLRSPLLTLHQTLDLDLSLIKKLVHGDLLDLTLLPAMFSDPRPGDARYKERREFALALCMFAKYFFVSMCGFVDVRVIDIVFQVRFRRTNMVSIILGETLHGFDHYCSGERHIFDRGSPLLLHMWLQEHFRVVKPFIGDIYVPSAYGSRSFGRDGRKTEREWLNLFANCVTDDILWTPPHWRLKRFMIYSTSRSHVLLPGLRRSTFYFGDRITRQFGRAQRIPLINFCLPKTEIMDAPLAHLIAGCWSCFLDRRTVEAGNPPESIYLHREYLEWLIPKVEDEYMEILATLSVLVDGPIADGSADRLSEMNEPVDFPHFGGGYLPPRQPEPIDAYLAKVPKAHRHAPKSRDSGDASSSGAKKGKKRMEDNGSEGGDSGPRKSVFTRLGK